MTNDNVQVHQVHGPVIGHLGPFDVSTSWSNYQERLEFFFEANDIVDVGKKRAILLTQFGASAYEVLRSLVTPQGPKDFTYEQLVVKLKNHFNPKPNEIIERFNFNKRTQKKGESIADFVADLRKLSKFCNFTELNNMLRDRVVCGATDEDLQKKLFAEPNLTFDRAYELALAAETAQKNVEEVRITTEYAVAAVGQRKEESNHNPCYHCGKKHDGKTCRFKDVTCNYCGKKGHIKAACFKKKNEEKERNAERRSGKSKNCNQVVEDDCDLYTLNLIHAVQERKKMLANVKLNGVLVQMEVDSGAVCSIIRRQTWEKIKKENNVIRTATLRLQTWTQENISIMGEATVEVRYNQIQKYLRVVISNGGGCDLLGRDWFEDLGISVHGVFGIDGRNTPMNLYEQFPNVFGGKLGQFRGKAIKLELNEGTTPIFLKYRQVPFALKPAVEKELDKLVQQGVLESTEYSEWATPLVPIRKSDGQIRLCGDYRSTVNKAIKKNSYPLPTITEMITLTDPSTIFSKIDLSQAYQQLHVDDETAKVLTVNTHRGLFRVKRLPFGINAAPGLFQKFMEMLLVGIPGVKIYLDDVMIRAKNKKEHDDRLLCVLERLERAGLTVKKEKCEIGKSEITFLGYRLTAEGVRPTEERIKAIKDAPRPTNRQELQSFLGMINFYNRFLKDKAAKAEPLHRLLDKESAWQWNDQHERAFVELKGLLRSKVVLTHYDESKLLVISCDSSPYGVGAILSHRENGIEKPIAYWSRTLNKSQRNYAQIDKEALAIVEGVKHFHQFVAGRKFIITTDHQPLLGLFNPKKPIPVIVSPRMLRWCLTLSAYDYEVEFRKGTENANADCLSRLPQQQESDEMASLGDILLLESNNRPIPIEEIQKLTSQDKILRDVRYWTWHQWPNAELEEEYKPYHRRKSEISVYKNCLLWGNRLIAPEETRGIFMKLLHANHPGVVAMKACARSYVWWPNIDQEIENCVATCQTCQIHQNNPAKAPRQRLEPSVNPWSTLHVDFAGPYRGKVFLIVVDAMSKWLEVDIVKSMASSEVIKCLRKMFARLGIPDKVVSDNGRSFDSEELHDFYKKNLIEYSTISPYHPSSNGQAERMVQVTKKSLAKLEEGDIGLQVQRMLFRQHTTVHAGTAKTPAELLMGRKLRTVLDKMHPYALKSNHREEKEVTKKLRSFEEGDAVYFRNYNSLGPKWLEGTIEDWVTPVSYRIRLSSGNVIKRHIDQLRRRVVNSAVDDNKCGGSEPTSALNPSSVQSKIPAQVPLLDQSTSPQHSPRTCSSVPDFSQAREIEMDTESRAPVTSPQIQTGESESSEETRMEFSTRPVRNRKLPTYLKDYVK